MWHWHHHMTSVDFGNISLFVKFIWNNSLSFPYSHVLTPFFTTEDVIVDICSHVYDLNSFILSSTLHYVQLLLKLWQNLFSDWLKFLENVIFYIILFITHMKLKINNWQKVIYTYCSKNALKKRGIHYWVCFLYIHKVCFSFKLSTTWLCVKS